MKRETDLHIRMTQAEKAKICKRAAKCGLPPSTFVRQIISGYEPKEKHDEIFHEVMRILCEVYATANQKGYTEIKAQLTVAIEKLSCG